MNIKLGTVECDNLVPSYTDSGREAWSRVSCIRVRAEGVRNPEVGSQLKVVRYRLHAFSHPALLARRVRLDLGVPGPRIEYIQ